MGLDLEAGRVMPSSPNAVYVYCLVAAPRQLARVRPLRGLPGGTRPIVSPAGTGLFMVSSEVPLSVYGPPHLAEHLGDLDWVSQVAVAHERVVELFARTPSITLVPMKMFTMFSTFDKAVANIQARRRAIDEVIARVAGCEEWGVRVSRLPATAAAPRDARGRSTPPRSGTAFLTARKAARDQVASSRQRSQEAAVSAVAALRRLARDVRRRDSTTEPGSNPPLVEAAFLVATPARTRFKSAARRQAVECAAAGAALVLTGPWPAYNFVVPEDES